MKISNLTVTAVLLGVTIMLIVIGIRDDADREASDQAGGAGVTAPAARTTAAPMALPAPAQPKHDSLIHTDTPPNRA